MDAATAAPTMTIDRVVPSGCHIQITVAGGSGAGSVLLQGTDTSSNVQSETLSFSTNGTKVSTLTWGTLTSITTSGFATLATPPTVAAKSVSVDGTPILLRYSVAASRPMMESPMFTPDYKVPVPGGIETDKVTFVLDFESSWTPRVEDIAIDDATSEEWLVRGVRDVRFGFGVRTAFYSLMCGREQV